MIVVERNSPQELLKTLADLTGIYFAVIDKEGQKLQNDLLKNNSKHYFFSFSKRRINSYKYPIKNKL